LEGAGAVDIVLFVESRLRSARGSDLSEASPFVEQETSVAGGTTWDTLSFFIIGSGSKAVRSIGDSGEVLVVEA
jgi:hypothetical protein